MSNHPVTLSVPEYVYERAQQIARENDTAVETVLVQHLETAFAGQIPLLPIEEQRELDALKYLSDDALWTIAREQMPHEKQTVMQGLMDKNSLGTIAETEYAELELLVGQGQRLMLRKAQAAALLTERGFKITPNDMAVDDE